VFDRLAERLSETFKALSGRGVLTEANVSDAMREIRRALLEADVNFKVAGDFVARAREKALGERVLKSLTPGQQVVKIVHDQLVELLGEGGQDLSFSGSPPHVVLLCGLQGSGKTTTAARLAWWLARKKNRRSLLAACDLQRPAAVDQLEVMAGRAGAGFYCDRSLGDPAAVAREAVNQARIQYYDTVIVDTAGRLHVDRDLMDELVRVKDAVRPEETLLVLDGLTGQDAVKVAVQFQEQTGFTGAVLTKMDGDSRGGAALSFTAVTGMPVKFVGTGEGVDGLEVFDARRLAGRILGMGDVVGLAEKAQEGFDREEAVKLEKKLRNNDFTLEDFADQIRKIRKMGSLSDILAMLPAGLRPAQADMDTGSLVRFEAVIGSMTPQERRRPELINGSRRKRIAMGSGTRVSEVNRLLSQFRDMKKMMKRMKTMKRPGARGGLSGLFR
jgi:signal recognition particle subunit SRP54